MIRDARLDTFGELDGVGTGIEPVKRDLPGARVDADGDLSGECGYGIAQECGIFVRGGAEDGAIRARREYGLQIAHGADASAHFSAYACRGHCAQRIRDADAARFRAIEIDNVYDLRAVIAPLCRLGRGVFGKDRFLGVVTLDQIDAQPAPNIHRGDDAHR